MTTRIRELIERLERYVEIVKRHLQDQDRNTEAQIVELHGCVRRLHNAYIEEKARRQLRDDFHNL